jgi:hypothetical protein
VFQILAIMGALVVIGAGLSISLLRGVNAARVARGAKRMCRGFVACRLRGRRWRVAVRARRRRFKPFDRP